MPGPKLPIRDDAARTRAREEAAQLQGHVALQQRRVPRDRRVGRVHQRVPVDLVQPDRRVAPEGAVRGAVDRVADSVHRRVRELELTTGAVGVDEAVDDFGVEDEVLRSAAGHRVHPAGRVRLARGGRVRERAGGHELGGERAGALVVAGEALVVLHRGDAVGQQHHRVGHRLDAAAAELEVAGVRVPLGVERLLHAVGEGPVVGVGVRGGVAAGAAASNTAAEAAAAKRERFISGAFRGVPGE